MTACRSSICLPETHLLILDGGLHLQFAVLYDLDQLAGGILVDPVMQLDLLLELPTGRVLGLAEFHRLGIDLATHKMGNEHVADGANLHLITRHQRKSLGLAVEFHFRDHALEVVSCFDFLAHVFTALSTSCRSSSFTISNDGIALLLLVMSTALKSAQLT